MFCKKCGAPLSPDGVCPQCGAQAPSAAPAFGNADSDDRTVGATYGFVPNQPKPAVTKPLRNAAWGAPVAAAVSAVLGLLNVYIISYGFSSLIDFSSDSYRVGYTLINIASALIPPAMAIGICVLFYFISFASADKTKKKKLFPLVLLPLAVYYATIGFNGLVSSFFYYIEVPLAVRIAVPCLASLFFIAGASVLLFLMARSVLDAADNK